MEKSFELIFSKAVKRLSLEVTVTTSVVERSLAMTTLLKSSLNMAECNRTEPSGPTRDDGQYRHYRVFDQVISGIWYSNLSKKG
jgi:hypothetical protein